MFTRLTRIKEGIISLKQKLVFKFSSSKEIHYDWVTHGEKTIRYLADGLVKAYISTIDFFVKMLPNKSPAISNLLKSAGVEAYISIITLALFLGLLWLISNFRNTLAVIGGTFILAKGFLNVKFETLYKIFNNTIALLVNLVTKGFCLVLNNVLDNTSV